MATGRVQIMPSEVFEWWQADVLIGGLGRREGSKQHGRIRRLNKGLLGGQGVLEMIELREVEVHKSD